MIVAGHLLDTIEDYESKQNEIAIRKGIDCRWAGRHGKPDIRTLDGKYFCPDELGLDTMNTGTDVPTFKKNDIDIIE